MKTKTVFLIWFAVALGGLMTSCDSQAKRQRQARTFYERGVQLRSQRLSEDAAECFLQALSLAENGDDVALTANIKDNLGAMYNKHQLFEEALAMHRSAVADFKEINDSIGMMTAWRNCGRTTKSLELFAQTKAYYDSAFHIAALLRDLAMTNDLYLEIGRDYYMEIGNYPKAIECVQHAMDGGLDGNDLDIANMTLGILYYYVNRNDEAKVYLEQALRSDRAGVKMSVYQTLYGIALNEKNIKMAMNYEERFLEYMKLVEKENNNENILRIKAEYELKAQKSELETIHRTKSFKLYLIIAVTLSVALAILLIVRKKISDNKIEMEQFKSQVERDQNRIHELVSDMENLIRTNDELRRDHQTLSQKELLMTNKIMSRNKVFVTAQGLSEHVTAESLNFNLSDDDWADFISLTDLVYDGFSQRLLSLYQKLGKWDVRICCLSKNGFSNQVISILLDTQTDSYYKRKTRIKQMKMNLVDDNRTFEEIVNAV
ncbi:MAG: tetratricopeptide repeat protein [Bacteroidales bacterium]|nr:tetratricopeptide repeat protein [Bacteroidales bacterium]